MQNVILITVLCLWIHDNVLKSGIPNAIRVFDEVLKPMGIQKMRYKNNRQRRYNLSFKTK